MSVLLFFHQFICFIFLFFFSLSNKSSIWDFGLSICLSFSVNLLASSWHWFLIISFSRSLIYNGNYLLLLLSFFPADYSPFWFYFTRRKLKQLLSCNPWHSLLWTLHILMQISQDFEYTVRYIQDLVDRTRGFLCYLSTSTGSKCLLCSNWRHRS